jgi:hypothetical protein
MPDVLLPQSFFEPDPRISMIVFKVGAAALLRGHLPRPIRVLDEAGPGVAKVAVHMRDWPGQQVSKSILE